EEAKAILRPPDRPRVGSSATRQYYWSMYDRYVRESACETSQTANDVKFRQDGYALGELPREFAARLHKAVRTAPVIRYSSAEQTTGFIAPSYDSELDSDINGHSQFRALDSAGKALLDEALVQMRDQVASFLGAPWRVIAAKCWTTPPGKPPV